MFIVNLQGYIYNRVIFKRGLWLYLLERLLQL